MFEHPTTTQKRCLTYIENIAEVKGIKYDLTETHANRDALTKLWDACLTYEANNELYTNELLQALCDNLLDASKISVLQGVEHKEPADMSVYQRLFNHNLPMLNMCDVLYSPPVPIQLEIRWSIESDLEEVLKLAPGVQLKLQFEDIQEKAT